MSPDDRSMESQLRAALRSPTPPRDPERTWAGIRSRLARPEPRRVPLPLAAAAGVLATVVGAAGGLWWHYAAPQSWAVVSGTSASSGAPAAPGSRLRVGDWLQPDAQVRLAVGRIGHVDVEAGSRMRIERNGWGTHRIRLERGTLEAVIGAPPRLFVVETPAAIATDLGCAYRIDVDADGRTQLLVTAGWVELGKGDRAVLVPAGLRAEVETGRVPGTPVVPSLDSAARAAIRRLDRGVPRPDDVARILAAMPSPRAAVVTRQMHGVTLWHLLSRTDREARAEVFDALAGLSAPPAGVTREGILALDRRMLDGWRRSLSPMWGEEQVPPWTALGRRLWLWAAE